MREGKVGEAFGLGLVGTVLGVAVAGIIGVPIVAGAALGAVIWGGVTLFESDYPSGSPYPQNRKKRGPGNPTAVVGASRQSVVKLSTPAIQSSPDQKEAREFDAAPRSYYDYHRLEKVVATGAVTASEKKEIADAACDYLALSPRVKGAGSVAGSVFGFILGGAVIAGIEYGSISSFMYAMNNPMAVQMNLLVDMFCHIGAPMIGLATAIIGGIGMYSGLQEFRDNLKERKKVVNAEAVLAKAIPGMKPAGKFCEGMIISFADGVSVQCTVDGAKVWLNKGRREGAGGATVSTSKVGSKEKTVSATFGRAVAISGTEEENHTPDQSANVTEASRNNQKDRHIS